MAIIDRPLWRTLVEDTKYINWMYMTDREQGEREKSRSQQFEELVAEVFRAHNFKVDEQVRYQVGGATGRADLVLTWANEVVTAVEVKLYRSRARYLPDADQAIA